MYRSVEAASHSMREWSSWEGTRAKRIPRANPTCSKVARVPVCREVQQAVRVGRQKEVLGQDR